MVANNIIAPYAINGYVLELLRNNLGGFRAEDYGGKIPIVPSGQDADLLIFNKPFLVYGYSEDTTPDLYASNVGSLSYAIYSTVGGEISAIMNVIRTAMEKHDETAREVNDWTSTIPHFLGIRFGSITVGYHEGPSPEETEGGRKAGIITLRYQYFAEYAVKTFKDGQWRI